MSSEEKVKLAEACAKLQRVVEEMSVELALLRNALYVPARPGDFNAPRKQ